MIVIPPATVQEGLFKAVAEKTWKQSLTTQPDFCDALKSENRTLIAELLVTYEDGEHHSCIFHYRFFKGDLYCFIEESSR
jgi:hypothetical protein